ncbi:hypothetical protein PAEPH01_0422 [Pancytospora epiphaga]|nr:hypothetical protein PAEPH01_0422 [Pancytospora epiphaga]
MSHFIDLKLHDEYLPMDRTSYCKGVIGRHKRLMERIDKETPPLIMKARLISQDTSRSGLRSTFSISSTSRSTRLTNLIESRVFIEEQGGVSGTVIEAYDNKLVIWMHRKFPQDTFVLKIFANYNNEILLKAGIAFAESEKNIHSALLRSKGESVEYKGNRISQIGNSKTEKSSQAEVVESKVNNGGNGHSCGYDIAIPEISDDDIEGSTFFNKNLNKSQKKAVFMASLLNPFKILGPPGTGKTETIVEIIVQSLSAKKTVLVCGPSNISVDNIITRFSSTSYCLDNNVKFYRLGCSWKGLFYLNLEYMASQAVAFLDEETKDLHKGKARTVTYPDRELKQLKEDKNQRKKDFIRNLKSETSLVFATLFSSLKENFYFDLCIVDEACQATEMECFMGVVKAKTFILVGDPNQLCPDFPSLYERTVLPTVVLDQQYRMPGEIIRFSNEYFYGDRISSSRLDDFLFFGVSKILFIDTAYFSYTEATEGTSRINEEEGLLTAKVAEWLVNENCPEHSENDGSKSIKTTKKDLLYPKNNIIGIIVPYSAQVIYIRSLLEAQSGCTVDTVDGFQGQERDFIILSLVRSNAEGEYGFLQDIKRMNVALTRCRRGLVIIGDSHNFRKNSFFRDFFRFLNKYAYVVDPEMFKELAMIQK